MLDYYSRWLEIKPKMNDQYLTEWIPSIIVSDKGPQLSSGPLLLSFSKYEVVPITTLAKCPRAKGEVEGQTAQSQQCSRMKSCIQSSLLTDLLFSVWFYLTHRVLLANQSSCHTQYVSSNLTRKMPVSN